MAHSQHAPAERTILPRLTPHCATELPPHTRGLCDVAHNELEYTFADADTLYSLGIITDKAKWGIDDRAGGAGGWRLCAGQNMDRCKDVT